MVAVLGCISRAIVVARASDRRPLKASSPKKSLIIPVESDLF